MTCQSATPAPTDEKAQRNARRARRSFRKSANRLVEHIGRKLERRHKVSMFPPQDLAALHITLGVPLDIDAEDPLDIEPRFFLPSPLEPIRSAVNAFEGPRRESTFPLPTWREMVGEFQPIEWRREWNNDIHRLSMNASGSCHEACLVRAWCRECTRSASDWRRQPFIHDPPWARKSWMEPNGRMVHHTFRSDFVFVRCSPKNLGRDQDVPHAWTGIADSMRPADGCILRSELVAATYLVGTQLRNLDECVDHDIFPALIISMHGRFSARIIQAHVDADKRFVIRASRLIKLNTPAVNSEVELLLRWHIPRPIGETQRQVSDDDPVLPPNTTLPIRCAVPGQALQQALTV